MKSLCHFIAFFCHQIVIQMKKILLAILTVSSFTTDLAAQNGKENIEKLCGCFSVNFKYAETFSPDNTYKFHEREEMNATELVLPIEKSDRKMVMQHLLVINDTMIIKHWREEWEYESPVLYEYAGNKTWNKKQLPASDVAGKWTQTVWEVNDEPRYQGISSWIANDGKVFWESTADAPLPRREYTVRNDYNIMKRHNRIVLTKDGYMHEQDNDKIVRAAGATDKLLAQEKGYNSYYKMDNSQCAAAEKWWKTNEAFWNVVRAEWQGKISTASTVAVKARVEDKRLDEYFTALYKNWNNNKIKTADLPAKVKDVLAKFL